jgi:sulfite dehydrogenase
MKTATLCLITAGVLGAVRLGALEIKLPEEKARLAESHLPGYSLASTYCYTCHSVDYVLTQPISSRAYWRSAVVKMQKTFGAPIPDSAIDPIAEYLAKSYGTEQAASAAPTSAVPAPAAASPSPNTPKN